MSALTARLVLLLPLSPLWAAERVRCSHGFFGDRAHPGPEGEWEVDEPLAAEARFAAPLTIFSDAVRNAASLRQEPAWSRVGVSPDGLRGSGFSKEKRSPALLSALCHNHVRSEASSSVLIAARTSSGFSACKSMLRMHPCVEEATPRPPAGNM